ncbi:hypothetical protein MMC14_004303 [Varicellaria rhodocarpa]|nr:hypothetical protein [Varicellaria rhodocarpa]
MDTSAYLAGQGWLGNGHSLDPTGRGLKGPLLVSRKSNTFGVGLKKHDAHADQWWARAFDDSLKNLDVSNNEITGDTIAVTAGLWGELDFMKAGGAKWVGNGGLYAGFVKGEGLGGTLRAETQKFDEDRNQALSICLKSPARERLDRKRISDDGLSQDEKPKRRKAIEATEVMLSREEQHEAQKLRKLVKSLERKSNGEGAGIQTVEITKATPNKDERRQARRLRKLQNSHRE